SRAALFIEELSFGHNLAVERFTLDKPPAEVVRRTHDQLQGKRQFDGVVNPERCINLIPAWHNDQDIHVAVFVGRAVSVGAEKDRCTKAMAYRRFKHALGSSGVA